MARQERWVDVEDPVVRQVQDLRRHDPAEVGEDPESRGESADLGRRLRGADPGRLEEGDPEPCRGKGDGHLRRLAVPA
jgi:hypothetical protein